MPAATEGTIPSLSDLVRLQHRRRSALAAQMLWSKLEEDASLFLLSAQRGNLTDQDKVVVEQCRQKLELARSCIDRMVMRPTAFWQIIHEVDALLVRVLPEEQLANRAIGILQKFELKVTDPAKRRLWLGRNEDGPLHAAVKRLAARGGDLSKARSSLSGALDVLNEQVDQGFWELNTNVSIKVFSALLLLCLTVLWWVLTNQALHKVLHLGALSLFNLGPFEPERYFAVTGRGVGADIPFAVMLPFIMFGLAGATISNMLSKRPFVVAVGSTVRFYTYHLLVKPLLGGFAALFLIFIERSDLLLAVVIREGEMARASRAALQLQANSPQAAVFTMAMLSLGVGFFADRFFSKMMDRVQDLLFKKSEKLQPSTPTAGTTKD